MSSPTSPSPSLAADDLRVLRALQIAPRASVALLAAVLDSSEATMTRRLRRLHREGAARVIGVTDTRTLGQTQYMLRIDCRPAGAIAIANALAEREEVSWVALTAAGTEVTCAVLSRTSEQRDDLLGTRLPRASAVLGLRAAMILRLYLGGRGHYGKALQGLLTAEQEQRLRHEHPVAPGSGAGGRPALLNRAEQRLLAALALDGRAGLASLAASTGSTPGRVSRQMQALRDRGVLDFDVEIAASSLGLEARANLWLRVHPGALDAVASAMTEMVEIVFVAAVSGRDNLHAVAHCADLDTLFELTSGRLGALPGVQSLEVSPVFKQVKQAATRVEQGRLAVTS